MALLLVSSRWKYRWGVHINGLWIQGSGSTQDLHWARLTPEPYGGNQSTAHAWPLQASESPPQRQPEHSSSLSSLRGPRLRIRYPKFSVSEGGQRIDPLRIPIPHLYVFVSTNTSLYRECLLELEMLQNLSYVKFQFISMELRQKVMTDCACSYDCKLILPPYSHTHTFWFLLLQKNSHEIVQDRSQFILLIVSILSIKQPQKFGTCCNNIITFEKWVESALKTATESKASGTDNCLQNSPNIFS